MISRKPKLQRQRKIFKQQGNGVAHFWIGFLTTRRHFISSFILGSTEFWTESGFSKESFLSRVLVSKGLFL